MSRNLLRDPRLRAVDWRPLTRLTKWDVAHELFLPVPWLALSLGLAALGWYVPAMLASFVFFLTGLRQVHNAFHVTLGLSRAGCDAVMFALSVLMLGSMHAVRVNHLRHHRHCLDDEDVEAMSARMGAAKALLTGPLFPFLMHRKALQVADTVQRRWIVAELLANAAWVGLVFGALDVAALRYHVVVMALGQCFASFFCVWTVHHDCDGVARLARTLRGRLRNLATFSMFFHAEHHLFPQVPTSRLAALAERLDRVAPDLGRHRVF